MEDTENVVTYDTPWRSQAELKQVYLWLYRSNSTGSSMIQALVNARNKILVWSIRCPHFKNKLELQVTQHFLNAVIVDKEIAAAQESRSNQDASVMSSVSTDISTFAPSGSTEKSLHGELILPPLYSTAVVKFCDLLKFYTFDYGSVKRLSSKESTGSLLEKSEKLGIPEWIVDARNEAAHASMPSLDLLRHASFICMDWLNRHFWQPRAERCLSVQIATAVQDITQKTENFKASGKFVTNCLANDSTHTIIFLNRILISMESVTVPEKLTASWSPSDQPLIPQQVLTSIMPILRRVYKANLLHDLLLNLVSHFDSLVPGHSVRSIYWFCQIVTCMTSHKPKTDITISRKILKNNLKFALEYKNVLYAICRKPSSITKTLILHLRPLMPFARKAIETKLTQITELCYLTNISLLQDVN